MYRLISYPDLSKPDPASTNTLRQFSAFERLPDLVGSRKDMSIEFKMNIMKALMTRIKQRKPEIGVS